MANCRPECWPKCVRCPKCRGQTVAFLGIRCNISLLGPRTGAASLASAACILYPRWTWPACPGAQCPGAGAGSIAAWRMSWWSAPSGATKAKARSSTGCPNRPTSSSASRAATTPATRWSSMARPTSSHCCRPAWCAAASCRSSAMAWWSIRTRCSTKSPLKKQGVAVTPDNLRIAENAPLILPLHRELDALRESRMRHEHRHHQARHRPRL